MNLRYLSVRNYRPFKSVELELPGGLVSIMGPNGSGKSSLMEAVAWALYGNQTEIVRTGKESVKREGSAPKDPCSVAIEFDFENTLYRLERGMKGKSLTMSASLTAGDNLLARDSDDVTKAVEKLFGMDHKSFFISVFARQKELNALTSHPKHMRKKLVLRMLEIENIDEAIKRIREDGRFLRSGLDEARRKLTDEDGRDATRTLETEAKSVTKLLDEQTKTIAKSSKVLEKIRKEHKSKRAELEKMEGKRKKVENLELKKAKVESGLAGLGRNLEVLERDIEELEELAEAGAELEGKSAKAEKEMEAIVEKKERAREERDLALRRKAELTAAIKRERGDIEEFEASIGEIEELGPESECPTCKRKLEDTYKKLITQYNKQIKAKEKSILGLEEKVSKTEDVQSEVDARLKALDKRERLLNEKVKEWKGVSGKLEGLESLKKRMSEAMKEKDGLEKELETLMDDRNKVDFDEEAFGGVKVAVDELADSMMAFERELGEMRVTEAGIGNRLENLRKDILALRELKEEVASKLVESEILQALEKVMEDFKRHLISRIRPALAAVSSELIAELTGGKYSDIELSEEYEISIRDGAVYHDIDRFSGGEKDLANLCLRLAISEVLAEKHGSAGFGFIVLDEIFGSQDSERKRSLLTTLNGLGNRFKQIFLITHVEDMRDMMGNVILVSENEDGTSTAEVI